MRTDRKPWEAMFLYFLMYSFFGWVYEVFLEVVVYRWGYSDRGVLFGPWCPVYGVGALIFLVCFWRLRCVREPKWLRYLMPLLLFFGCAVVATVVELLTSYGLEYLTGSWPWQTYVDYAVNFEGRIALSPSVRFGIGGVAFLYVVQPLFRRAVGALAPRVRTIVFTALAGVFLVDLAATVAVAVSR